MRLHKKDADYVDESTDTPLVSGKVVICGGAAVSWASSTQRRVTMPTTEAEHVAPGVGAKESLFTGGTAIFYLPRIKRIMRPGL